MLSGRLCRAPELGHIPQQTWIRLCLHNRKRTFHSQGFFLVSLNRGRSVAYKHEVLEQRSFKGCHASTSDGAGASISSKLQAAGADAAHVLAHPELKSADNELLSINLAALSTVLPRRSLPGLLERHPPILTTPVATWIDFLTTFGFQKLAIQELLLNSPDVISSSSVFRAGQVFLFLKQLGVPTEQIAGPIFRWRGLLADGVDFKAAATFLTAEAGLAPDLLSRVALEFPALLAVPVEDQLRPHLALLQALGPEGAKQLRGVLYEEWCGWIHGLANWSTAVAPKLGVLEAVMGSRPAAEALLAAAPAVLRHPAESRLAPNLRLLRGLVGLGDQALASLLSAAPDVLSLPPELLESRWTFLIEVLNGGPGDLLAYPSYLTTSLAKVIGPRFFFTALQGLTDRLMAPACGSYGHDTNATAGNESCSMELGMKLGTPGTKSGTCEGWGAAGGCGGAMAGLEIGGSPRLDLRWLCAGSSEEWLARVAAARGQGVEGITGDAVGDEGEAAAVILRGEWEEAVSEWESLLGWCCDRAFTEAGRKRFEEQLSLFYLLVQG